MLPMRRSQPIKYWLSVSRPANATTAPQSCDTRCLNTDFGKAHHSARDTYESAKQNVVGRKFDVGVFGNSKPKAQCASARLPMSRTLRLVMASANLNARIRR